ncbi:GyrI-like domain-containing protein [Robertkochia flava]|uniref:GyrI-like domain-containing protein n=1 Tax=Robertkochia flava TaxID=3447986 RepID=UPI001CCA0D70|nr:GyrI-like domain-containing protein [Robertkochia marina]
MISPERIINSPGFRIIGIKRSFEACRIQPQEPWMKFMPLLKTLASGRADSYLYAVQEYQTNPDSPQYGPATIIHFWAGIRMRNEANLLPKEVESLTVTSGSYAVFLHRGPAREFSKTMDDILNGWLPDSGYVLEQRPHLQVMTPEYKGPEHPDAEEEVWVPVRLNE